MTVHLVLDTKTNRVIKYSPETLSAAGQNSCLAQTAALPPGITEENCWEYRFVGGEFRHAPARPSETSNVGLAAELREAKYVMRKQAIDNAQKRFHRKVPLNALAYIATLDAARKWLKGESLEPVELRFVPSLENANEFMKMHYDNLEKALTQYIPMSQTLDLIDKAQNASDLEKIPL
ncbi:hypothetical protein ACSFBX_27385 [Variovorax sp. RB2P76]|uniref:hypothetical protein n=1 Tax=Variovorax sp. RB2P76 TaxID=3443736 RepID=UPI003F486F2A